jgi:GrpB-like predicted nucleotidyltransferase (UPF0157 family)
LGVITSKHSGAVLRASALRPSSRTVVSNPQNGITARLIFVDLPRANPEVLTRASRSLHRKGDPRRPL